MLLRNLTYSGKVRYRGVVYPGEEPAIVNAILWEEVSAGTKRKKPGDKG